MIYFLPFIHLFNQLKDVAFDLLGQVKSSKGLEVLISARLGYPPHYFFYCFTQCKLNLVEI
jgi:hypothetical protein